jgi:hypothetical protein
MLHDTDAHMVVPPKKSVAATELRITLNKQPLPLSICDEKRFAQLAAKEALDEIAPAEMKELEELDKRRTATQRELPAEAIMARERLFAKMDALLAELESLGR